VLFKYLWQEWNLDPVHRGSPKSDFEGVYACVVVRWSLNQRDRKLGRANRGNMSIG